jgi:hypothetical protein
MRHFVDPQQDWLFDPSLGSYSSLAQRRLLKDWPGVFRTCILEMMPVEEMGKHFSKDMGRPTKELYSACGLLLLQEFNNWTVEEAADMYMFDGRIQFALNLGRDRQTMSTRTIERYRAVFRDEAIAQDLMTRVTARLIELLELKVDKLRLDSTHVFSNMATFGRTRLMMTVMRRFLIQIKRHNAESYLALSEDLRKRYQKKSWDFSKGSQSHAHREHIATDMQLLIARYEDDDSVNTRNTFQDMVRVFNEQCEIIEEKVCIRKKPGGATLQNPSDPDATFDGKKGVGYQVQTAETCSDENETQLIVSTIPQSACEHDQNAIEKVVDDLKGNGMKPCQIIADAGYGGDRNHTQCSDQGIDLIAPVLQASQKMGRIDLCYFQLSDDGCITSCPAGISPAKAWFDKQKKRGGAVFHAHDCQSCEKFELCLARKNGKNYSVYYDSRAVRIAERKQNMQKPETRAVYAKRSGVEALYSIGKRTMGLGRLRVRGRSSVFHSITMKILGINIMRASRNSKIIEQVREKMPLGACSLLKKQFHKAGGAICAWLTQLSVVINTRFQVSVHMAIQMKKHNCAGMDFCR